MRASCVVVVAADSGLRLPRDLADVYRSVDDGGEVLSIHSSANPRCPVGKNIQAVLEGRIASAERALLTELASTTVAELGGAIAARAAT